MKIFLHVIGGALISVFALSFAGCLLTPEIMAPADYETAAATGGELEAKYLARGAHEVKYFEEETDEKWKKYAVFYPAELERADKKYPVVVSSNGSGVRASRYAAIFEHYASWGFIAIGNEHDTAYAGDSSDASLAYLIAANDDPESVLYQKVDLENVGIIGHSQGGVGVFNAITAQPHSGMFKTAVALSPVSEKTAKFLNWTYDPTKIAIPVMTLAGTKNDCIAVKDLKSLYSRISSDKLMAVRSDANHPEMLYSADGYATAWFMWRLQGDEEAAKAFVGEDAEIVRNALYQDVQKSN